MSKILKYNHEKSLFHDIDNTVFDVPPRILEKAADIHTAIELRIQDLHFAIELKSYHITSTHGFFVCFSKDDYRTVIVVPPYENPGNWFDYMLHDVASEFGRNMFLKKS